MRRATLMVFYRTQCCFSKTTTANVYFVSCNLRNELKGHVTYNNIRTTRFGHLL